MPPPPIPWSTRATIRNDEVRRDPAQKGSSGEQADRQHVEPLAADDVAEPAADRQDDGVGDQIAGEDPGGLVIARPQRSRDIQQRDIGDRGVEHRHERRDRQDDRDEPRVVRARGRAARVPTLFGRNCRHRPKPESGFECTLTEGVTDMPGPSKRSGRLLNTSFTGTRCTTLT